MRKISDISPRFFFNNFSWYLQMWLWLWIDSVPGYLKRKYEVHRMCINHQQSSKHWWFVLRYVMLCHSSSRMCNITAMLLAARRFRLFSNLKIKTTIFIKRNRAGYTNWLQLWFLVERTSRFVEIVNGGRRRHTFRKNALSFVTNKWDFLFYSIG